MAEQRSLDPKNDPVHAAHEVVIELIKSQSLVWSNNNSYGTQRGDELADTAIAAHKKLVEYYKTLK